jgi:hypothetical protein
MAETVRSSATRGANCEPIDATTTSSPLRRGRKH